MRKKIIDLSVSLEIGINSDPPAALPKIDYISHQDSAEHVCSFFPGLQKDDLPEGEGWAVEQLNISTHNGTHLDAPYHFHSTMDRGKKAITIDQVPLEWCFNPGVKFDFRHMEDGYVVTPNDIKAELKRINYEIKPLDIVLVNTSAGKHYGADDYLLKGCGIGKDATIFLLEKGVKITGTDAWSWDAPFAHTAEKYRQTKDSSIIWEGHRAGMEKAYCHMEKLSSLEKLPDYGYTISCFPFKIKKASAGFIRAVAILDL